MRSRILETMRSRSLTATLLALALLPLHAPALLRAERMGEKAAREGFDWTALAGVREKVN